MKILALQGSPRPKGNTQTVLEMVLAAAKQAGAQTELVQLAKLKDLGGCLECFDCQKEANAPGCRTKDDMQKVIEKAIKSDVIVWATPVFCWSPAWLLKMAMDRFFCTFKFVGGAKVKCLLKGRRMAAVITAGGDEKDGADLVTETFKRMAKFSQAKWIGAMVAGHAEKPSVLLKDKKLKQKARAFGRRLAKK